ncbi:MAG TPA: MarR family transcriptional regulator [Gemmatimonadaceae bacterium]|nr:MarR family transcriptional regulator [Gemmatimonadaceae bacterium]
MPDGRSGTPGRKRAARPGAPLRAALNDAARAHSTATVLFHAAMNERQGLSATEGKALDLLARHGPLTAGQLAQRTGLAPASITELVDRLETKGFVRRRRDARDRRRVLVEFTPEKLAELAAVFERFGRSVDALWNEFSAEELEVVRRFLERATAFLQDAAARLREEDRTAR